MALAIPAFVGKMFVCVNSLPWACWTSYVAVPGGL